MCRYCIEADSHLAGEYGRVYALYVLKGVGNVAFKAVEQASDAKSIATASPPREDFAILEKTWDLAVLKSGKRTAIGSSRGLSLLD
jgi:hypothetical protein